MRILSLAKGQKPQLYRFVVQHCHPCVRLELMLQQLSPLPAEILLHVDL